MAALINNLYDKGQEMAARGRAIAVNSSCMTDCWTQAYENYDWVARRTALQAPAPADEILTPIWSSRRSGGDRVGPSLDVPAVVYTVRRGGRSISDDNAHGEHEDSS